MLAALALFHSLAAERKRQAHRVTGHRNNNSHVPRGRMPSTLDPKAVRLSQVCLAFAAMFLITLTAFHELWAMPPLKLVTGLIPSLLLLTFARNGVSVLKRQNGITAEHPLKRLLQLQLFLGLVVGVGLSTLLQVLLSYVRTRSA